MTWPKMIVGRPDRPLMASLRGKSVAERVALLEAYAAAHPGPNTQERERMRKARERKRKAKPAKR